MLWKLHQSINTYIFKYFSAHTQFRIGLNLRSDRNNSLKCVWQWLSWVQFRVANKNCAVLPLGIQTNRVEFDLFSTV